MTPGGRRHGRAGSAVIVAGGAVIVAAGRGDDPLGARRSHAGGGRRRNIRARLGVYDGVTKKTTLILPLLAVAAIAGGCGGGKSSGAAASSGGGYGSAKPTATQAAQAPADKPGTAGAAVEISGFAFHPDNIRVKVGDTITFTNEDSAAHTATATEGATFDSGALEQGKSFSYTAKKAGTIKFVCDFHPSMTGTITVS